MKLKVKEAVNTVNTSLKHVYEWIDMCIVLPACKKTVRFLNVRCEKRIHKYGLVSDWKENSLQDFRFWLSEIADEPSEGVAPGSDTCDLYTLLSEFSGLRKEIKLQNREQAKSVKSINGFAEAFQETFELLRRSASDLQNLETNVSRSAEKKSLTHFFEIRDALVRGIESVNALKKRSLGIFKKGSVDPETVIEGYQMILRRFDRAMEYSSILPVETVGKQFDPKTMKAVSVKQIKKGNSNSPDSGGVVEQVSGGFLRGDEVLKFAEVIVAE